jgi:hypothetical protein
MSVLEKGFDVAWKDPVGLERPVDPQAQDGAIGIQVSAQSTVGT